MNNQEKILMSKEGYEAVRKEREELIQKRNATGSMKKEVKFNLESGIDSIDNFEFENAVREDNALKGSINSINRILDNAVIIEEPDDKSIVGINCLVKIRLGRQNEAKREQTVLIVGKSCPDMNAKIKEITLNSPIGKAINGKKEGFVY